MRGIAARHTRERRRSSYNLLRPGRRKGPDALLPARGRLWQTCSVRLLVCGDSRKDGLRIIWLHARSSQG